MQVLQGQDDFSDEELARLMRQWLDSLDQIRKTPIVSVLHEEVEAVCVLESQLQLYYIGAITHEFEDVPLLVHCLDLVVFQNSLLLQHFHSVEFACVFFLDEPYGGVRALTELLNNIKGLSGDYFTLLHRSRPRKALSDAIL